MFRCVDQNLQIVFNFLFLCVMNELSVSELRARMQAGDPIILIDVREPHEHEDFNIGGHNIPVTALPFRIDEIMEFGSAEIVLYCQSGSRSGLAQKLLASQFNILRTINLVGGMNAWKEENV